MPVFVHQLALLGRHRCLRSDGPIAGEHALAQEVFRLLVDRELEVSEHEALRDAPFERGGQPVDVAHLDEALNFLARAEPQLHSGNDAEQSVATDDQPEQLGVFRAAAPAALALRINEHKGLHVIDEGLHLQPASVDVGGQRTANGEAIGAGLLLPDSPLARLPCLRLEQMVHQSRPHDAGLDLDDAFRTIE